MLTFLPLTIMYATRRTKLQITEYLRPQLATVNYCASIAIHAICEKRDFFVCFVGNVSVFRLLRNSIKMRPCVVE